tara:strand:- start:39673 stop:40371 length:699 start_codon:yes stop_codon:yes gene_type:complete
MTDKRKIKQWIEDVDFTQEGAHIAMCTDSGACSGMNEPYLLKSLDAEGNISKEIDVDSLTEDQIYILREIGEYPESLKETNKAVSDNDDTSVSKTKETKEDNMSNVTQEQYDALQKQIKVMTLEKTLAKYSLDADVEKGLAGAMAELEDVSGIEKALDAMVAAKDAAVEKAKADMVADKEGLIKSLTEKLEETNPLIKHLNEEAGHAKVEKAEPKSIVERALDTMDTKKEAK